MKYVGLHTLLFGLLLLLNGCSEGGMGGTGSPADDASQQAYYQIIVIDSESGEETTLTLSESAAGYQANLTLQSGQYQLEVFDSGTQQSWFVQADMAWTTDDVLGSSVDDIGENTSVILSSEDASTGAESLMLSGDYQVQLVWKTNAQGEQIAVVVLVQVL